MNRRIAPLLLFNVIFIASQDNVAMNHCKDSENYYNCAKGNLINLHKRLV